MALTSLEMILKRNNLTRNDLMLVMGIHSSDNQNTNWYKKFAGKNRVTPKELENIREALRSLKLPDTFDIEPVKFKIV